MGLIFSAIGDYVERVNNKTVDRQPISYMSAQDYTPAGVPREGVEEKWELAMKSMITADLSTRRLLFPVLHTRLQNCKASLRFTQCDVEEMLKKYPAYDDLKLFALHDLFQVFEVNGDGLIEISEMCVGLDNMGDDTALKDRIQILCKGDDDGTGSIDFEEFCAIIYELEIINGGIQNLAKSFKNIDDNVRFIRHMSANQQIQAGFF